MNNFRHLPLKITISLKSKTANRGQKSVNCFSNVDYYFWQSPWDYFSDFGDSISSLHYSHSFSSTTLMLLRKWDAVSFYETVIIIGT